METMEVFRNGGDPTTLVQVYPNIDIEPATIQVQFRNRIDIDPTTTQVQVHPRIDPTTTQVQVHPRIDVDATTTQVQVHPHIDMDVDIDCGAPAEPWGGLVPRREFKTESEFDYHDTVGMLEDSSLMDGSLMDASQQEQTELEIERFLKEHPPSRSDLHRRDIKVSELRRVIPQLIVSLYNFKKEPSQKKVKGMWNIKPVDWPLDLPFCDPNNTLKGKEGGGKPNQKMLLQMYSFLMKKYMESKGKDYPEQEVVQLTSSGSPVAMANSDLQTMNLVGNYTGKNAGTVASMLEQKQIQMFQLQNQHIRGVKLIQQPSEAVYANGTDVKARSILMPVAWQVNHSNTSGSQPHLMIQPITQPITNNSAPVSKFIKLPNSAVIKQEKRQEVYKIVKAPNPVSIIQKQQVAGSRNDPLHVLCDTASRIAPLPIPKSMTSTPVSVARMDNKGPRTTAFVANKSIPNDWNPYTQTRDQCVQKLAFLKKAKYLDKESSARLSIIKDLILKMYLVREHDPEFYLNTVHEFLSSLDVIRATGKVSQQQLVKWREFETKWYLEIMALASRVVEDKAT